VAVVLLLGTILWKPLRSETTANGTVVSIIADPQGAVIAAASVTLRNNDSSVFRSCSTGNDGRCTFAGIAPGLYTLEVRATGFATRKLPRVSVAIASTVRVRIALAVSAKAEQITVSGHGQTAEGNTVAPAVNKSEVPVVNYVAGLTVTYLPSRDRDLSQLAQLGAGTAINADAFGVVIAGQRATATEAAVDGADFDDPLLGGPRGSRDGTLFLPQTTVREFQLVRAGAGAEVSGTNAGLINVATKEGGNKVRGELFYLVRPPALTAQDAFGHGLKSLQNQFGGSVGGPVRRDRAFFYFGAEQDFIHVPYQTEFAPQAPGTLVPAALTSLEQPSKQNSSPTALFSRFDLIVNPANTVNIEVNLNRVHSEGVDGGSTRMLASPSHADDWTGRSLWLRGSLSTVFGQNVNQASAQWARDRRDLRPLDTSPEIFIDGFGVLGGDAFAPDRFVSQRREISDDVDFSHGSVLLRFGAQFAQDPVREEHEAYLNGRFDFSSLADFLNDQIRRYRQTFVNNDATLQGAERQIGFYARSNLHLGKTLSLTAGLRWDGQWNPQPHRPNPSIPQTTRIPQDLMQWQPRLGIAWNPRPATVVRISSGLYDAPTPATIFQRIFSDNGLNTTIVDSFFDPFLLGLASSPTFHALPAAPAGVTVPVAEVAGVAPDFRNPRSFQLSTTLEQEISKAVAVTAGYLRNSTWDLQRQVDGNLFPPTIQPDGLPLFSSARPLPGIGRLLVNESGAHSSYDALLMTMTLQLPRRSQLTANYTLSRTRDDDAGFGPFAPDLTLNPFDPGREVAYSTLDGRHNFNLNAVVNFLWGLKVNPVLVTRSGLPYTPVIGFDTNNDGNDWNDRPLIAGKVAPRNILRQPSLFDLDLRLVKDITLKGEGHHLDLFLDIFNITGATNRNFGRYALSMFGPVGASFVSGGQPLFAPDATRFGSARQVQFTARLVAF